MTTTTPLTVRARSQVTPLAREQFPTTRHWAYLNHAGMGCSGLARIGATLLSDRSGDARSGIVSFTVPGQDAESLQADLRARGFVCAIRSDALRIAPHGYNTEGESTAC